MLTVGQSNKRIIEIDGPGIYYLTSNGYLLNITLYIMRRISGSIEERDIVAKINIKIKSC